MRRVFFILMAFAFIALVGHAVGQDGPPQMNGSGYSSPRGPSGETMPAWIFYWLLGLGSAICGSLITALKVLWNKLQAAPVPAGLTDEQETLLTALKLATDDLVQVTKHDLAESKVRLGEQTARNERQQDKMLKLAVRSQRAIEAVANLTSSEIEEEIDDDGGI